MFCQQGGQYGGQHEGQDKLVIIGHFEDDENGRNRCPRCPRKNGRHAHNCIRSRIDRYLWPDGMSHCAHHTPDNGTHKQTRCKYTARVPAAQRKAGCQQLGNQQSSHQTQRKRKIFRNSFPNEFQPGTKRFALRQQQRHAQRQQHAYTGLKRRMQPPFIEPVFHKIKQPDKKHSHQSGQYAQHDVDRQFLELKRIGWHGKSGTVAQKCPTNHAGSNGTNHHCAKVADGEFAQDDFQGKNGSGNGGIKGGGNARG